MNNHGLNQQNNTGQYSGYMHHQNIVLSNQQPTHPQWVQPQQMYSFNQPIMNQPQYVCLVPNTPIRPQYMQQVQPNMAPQTSSLSNSFNSGVVPPSAPATQSTSIAPYNITSIAPQQAVPDSQKPPKRERKPLVIRKPNETEAKNQNSSQQQQSGLSVNSPVFQSTNVEQSDNTPCTDTDVIPVSIIDMAPVIKPNQTESDYDIPVQQPRCTTLAASLDPNAAKFSPVHKPADIVQCEKQSCIPDALPDVVVEASAGKDVADAELAAQQSVQEKTDEENEPYYFQVDKKESDATTKNRKMLYDRKFLVEIQKNIIKNKIRPEKLPAVSDFPDGIILSHSHAVNYDITSLHRHQPFNTKVVPIQRSPGHGHNKMNRSSRSNWPPIRQINLPQTPKLVRSEGGYKPPKLNTDREDARDEKAQLRRKIRAYLNKITPQNYEKCVSQILDMNIESRIGINTVIDEIFEKAITDESHSVTFAEVCAAFKNIAINDTVLGEGGEEKPSQIRFKGALLQKCQKMFETPLQEKISQIQENGIQESSSEMEIHDRIIIYKSRYFGNIRFIAELLIHDILSPKIIFFCISSLMDCQTDEDALLSLCKLIETCGEKLDFLNKQKMDINMNKIKDLIGCNSICTRVRFKLKDLVEMRARNWELRHIQQHKQVKPKTMLELEQETREEQKIASLKNMPRGSTGGFHPPVNNQFQYKRNNNINAQNLAMNKQSGAEASDVRLGPGSSNHWAQGAGSRASKPITPDPEEWSMAKGKKGRSARNSSFNTPNHHPLNIARRGSGSRDNSPGGNRAYNRTNQNRYSTLEDDSGIGGLEGPAYRHAPKVLKPVEPTVRNDGKLNPATQASATSATSVMSSAPESNKTVSDQTRSNHVIQEYSTIKNFDRDSFAKIIDKSGAITIWIEAMLDSDVGFRKKTGDLVSILLKEELIDSESFSDICKTYFENYEDYIYDMPKFWDYLADFLERLLCDESSIRCRLGLLYKILTPSEAFSTDRASTLLAGILKQSANRLGHGGITTALRSDVLPWNHVLGTDDESVIQAYIDKHNLGAFIEEVVDEFEIESAKPIEESPAHTSRRKRTVSRIGSEDAINEMKQALKTPDCTNEAIFRIMEHWKPCEDWSLAHNARLLSKILLEHIFLASSDFESVLSKRSDILRSIIKNPDSEAEVLSIIEEMSGELTFEKVQSVLDYLLTHEILSFDELGKKQLKVTDESSIFNRALVDLLRTSSHHK